MVRTTNENHAAKQTLAKAPTGIQGLDEVTEGGLPKGRPTLICGTAGCGKTLMAVEFLIRGIQQFGEPGVFMAFEETAEELADNVRSLGFNLDELVANNQLIVDYVHLDRSEIEETGEYDLEGLFVRLGHAIDAIGAKRVVLDTIEVVFAGLSDEAVLRTELSRLFRWLKQKGVTALITGERGDGTLTRHGLEEYISDCVILLDHRIVDQIATRRLRIVKYRGSVHGTNEFPFLIDEEGLSVVPITSAGMNHAASSERVSSGIASLDAMLEGKGYYRGSSILISGTAGTGKTSVAGHFVNAACGRGERCLYFSYEESQAQLVRNLRPIGLDLLPWIEKEQLQIHSARPSRFSMEMHLAQIHRQFSRFKPDVVVVDPISSFLAAGSRSEAGAMLVRLIDYLKSHGITSLFTYLLHGFDQPGNTEVGISSIIDTWVILRDIEERGERNCLLHVLKSRGMDHSRRVQRFQITSEGIKLSDTRVGSSTSPGHQRSEISHDSEGRGNGLNLQQEGHK